ncbi:hypothetical protein [Georgenia sp. SUBG003]|uniref:hypothetical protein n=1 Tax=Georgenia sp. SUBG003 TaxID=1497974 RepID=UPI003AB4B59D
MLLVAGVALGSAGWSLAAWLTAPLGVVVGAVSLVAAVQAFSPGDRRPRQGARTVGTVRP